MRKHSKRLRKYITKVVRDEIRYDSDVRRLLRSGTRKRSLYKGFDSYVTPRYKFRERVVPDAPVRIHVSSRPRTIRQVSRILRVISNPSTDSKRRCLQKLERADKARRRNFFRAKHSGGSSKRPEHNRKYKRSC